MGETNKNKIKENHQGKEIFLFDNSMIRFYGGATRDRTADLLHAMQALSQLSYSPVYKVYSVTLLFLNIFCLGVNMINYYCVRK